MKPALLLVLVPVLATAEEPPCRATRPSATVPVSLKQGSKLKDLAAWYRGVTCREVAVPPSVVDLPLNLAIEGALPANRALDLVVTAAASAGIDVRDDERSVTFLAPGQAPPPPPGEPTGCAVEPSAVTRRASTITVVAARMPGIDLECMMRSARFVPAFKDGVVQGMTLFGVRTGSLFDLLGAQNGDVLKRINGRTTDSPERLLETYEALRRTKKFEVLLERKGEPLRLDIVLR
jgi:hypothetical protein